MNTKIEKLAARFKEHASAAQVIARKADSEGRDYTNAERQAVDMHLAACKAAKHDMEREKADAVWRAKLSALGGDVDGAQSTRDPVTGGAVRHAMGIGNAWGKSVAARLTAEASRVGVKSLTSGSIDVPSPVTADVVALPQQPRLIDLLVNRQTLTSNSFEYLRQTARTNNAAPVADGGTKPTSVFTVTEIEDRARVVAHLSEAFPERYLSDYEALARWLDTEMYEGVLSALESEIIGGDGTGEHFTGVLETSGVTSVSFATDRFTTIRKARTALQVLGESPTAWAMHPTDLEAIDLTVDGESRYYLAGGGGNADALFGGLRRVPSTRVPVGTAILADWSQAALWVREDIKLDMDKSGTLFTKNQVVVRAEGRFGFGVLRPQAFAVVDLTA